MSKKRKPKNSLIDSIINNDIISLRINLIHLRKNYNINQNIVYDLIKDKISLTKQEWTNLIRNIS